METHKVHVEHEGDPNPCPEDDAVLMRPDAEQMEDAIGNFMDDMEKQEHGLAAASHTFTLCCQNSLCQCIPNVVLCHTKLP